MIEAITEAMLFAAVIAWVMTWIFELKGKIKALTDRVDALEKGRTQ